MLLCVETGYIARWQGDGDRRWRRGWWGRGSLLSEAMKRRVSFRVQRGQWSADTDLDGIECRQAGVLAIGAQELGWDRA